MSGAFAESMVTIGGRAIGAGHPCFVVAEAGVNHNGNLDFALRLVDAAADAGADAVKFQTFRADTLASPEAPPFPYVRDNGNGAQGQHEMLRRLELPREMHAPIRQRCEERGVMFLSTPFHETDADWLDEFGVPAFKIPSGEITNLPLLRHVSRKGKPIILSTGMAGLAEVARAVEVTVDATVDGTVDATVDAQAAVPSESAGAPQLVLLHCVSDYPAEPADANLRAMETLRRAFGVPVGFSDHTCGIEVALAAAALGAAVIEKHLTLDRGLPGPDHRASTPPDEFARLVAGIRIVESALGSGVKRAAASELKNLVVVRKSLVATRDLVAGERLSHEMLAMRRPGSGLPADVLPLIVGRRLARRVGAGTPIALDDLS